MHLVVRIDSMAPSNIVVGRLQHLTEVEIVPIKTPQQLFQNETNPSSQISRSFFNWGHLFSKSKHQKLKSTTVETLNKYNKPGLKIVSNVILLTNIDKLSISDETKTILEQPFNVYIYKKHLPKEISEDTTFIHCSITKILPPNIIEEDLTLIINLVVIDNFKLMPQKLFSKMNHSTCFINGYLHRLLRLENGMKVLIENENILNGSVDEIHIQGTTLGVIDTTNIGHDVTLYILEHSKHNSILLNSNCVLRISDSLYCYVRFMPGKCRYLFLNGDVLRDVKISIKSNLIDVENLKELTSGIYVKNGLSQRKIILSDKVCEKFNKKFGEILNFGEKCLEMGLGLYDDLETTNSGHLNHNILIAGQTGSGKTTIAKLLCQKLTNEPNFTYIKIIDCKGLRGKKVDTVQKVFVQNLDDCLYYQPSILLLDDLDIICGEPIETGEGFLTSEANYFNRMSEMLYILLSAYQSTNLISAIVTAQSTSKLNHHLYNSRGNHLFSTVLETPVLDKSDRENILKFILDKSCSELSTGVLADLHNYSLQTEGYVFQDFMDLKNKFIFESIKRGECAKKGQFKITGTDIKNALSIMVPLSFHDITLHKPIGRTWNEVGGLNQAKEMLIETILWPIQYPDLFDSCPIRLQTGVLLYGHPGTGKTILAGAAAQHFGLRLISVKGPELLSKYIGASEESVRNIFEKAQSAKPCILFFDEFDSLAPRRGHDSTGVTDRVVNQLLTQLDGVESLNGVYVMAATSRPDLLDPALIRPGRLGRQVHCPLPNQTDRLAILKALSSDLNLSDKVSLNELSKQTKGFTGADLQAVLYTAQLSAVDEVISSVNVEFDPLPKTVEMTQIHLLNALKQTRPSLSTEEKMKYDKIYSVFQGKEEKSKGAIRKQKVTLA